MKKAFMVVAVIVGLGCFYAAFIYWTTPANALPSYWPGFDPTLAGIHFKHGLAALIVGIGFFIFAWFQEKPRGSA